MPPDLTAMCAVTSDSVAAQPIPALSVSPTSRSRRRVEWFTLLDHRWELANQLDSDLDRKISRRSSDPDPATFGGQVRD